MRLSNRLYIVSSDRSAEYHHNTELLSQAHEYGVYIVPIGRVLRGERHYFNLSVTLSHRKGLHLGYPQMQPLYTVLSYRLSPNRAEHRVYVPRPFKRRRWLSILKSTATAEVTGVTAAVTSVMPSWIRLTITSAFATPSRTVKRVFKLSARAAP